ncbi:hypothetical protein ACTFIU_000696 [Dictyostelium citrinum]
MKSNEKRLTPTIFPYVVPYLINELKFLDILELSLLSKQSFKVIRNLITYHSKELKIVLGRYDQLKLYIQLSFIYSLSYSNYQFKLIQYKDIEYINLNKGNFNCHIPFSSDFHDHHVLIENNNHYKQYLLSHCPKLKHIHWDDININLLKSTEKSIDYTDNGFISYHCLILTIDFNNLPYSNTNECESLKFINTHTLQTQDVFSFKFIENFKPNILIINDINIGLLYNNIFKLNHSNLEILKCFRNIIGSSFLIESTINNLKQYKTKGIQKEEEEHSSLINGLKSFHINTICDHSNNTSSIKYDNCNTSNYFIEFKKEIQLIKELLINQTNYYIKLKKLKINFSFEPLINSNNDDTNQYINEVNSFKKYIDSIKSFNFNIIIKIKYK